MQRCAMFDGRPNALIKVVEVGRFIRAADGDAAQSYPRQRSAQKMYNFFRFCRFVKHFSLCYCQGGNGVI